MRSTANSRVRILLILFAQVMNTPQDECFYKFRVNFNISKYKISRLIITLKISSFSRRITETNKMDDANIGKPWIDAHFRGPKVTKLASYIRLEFNID